jgi:hypothetical protein
VSRRTSERLRPQRRAGYRVRSNRPGLELISSRFATCMSSVQASTLRREAPPTRWVKHLSGDVA